MEETPQIKEGIFPDVTVLIETTPLEKQRKSLEFMDDFGFFHNKELNTAPEESMKRSILIGLIPRMRRQSGYSGKNRERKPILFWADEQTAGKGRNNREFFSPKNTGLYFSYLYCVKKPKEIKDRIFVTTAAAVFTAKALRQYAGADAKIKWVNDIYLNEKKVCGILAEALFDEAYTAIIVGIGINLTTVEFPDEIKETASGIGKFSEEKLKELKEQIITLCRRSSDRIL